MQVFIRVMVACALISFNLYAYAVTRSITATGSAEVFIPQTLASLQISITQNEDNAKQAQDVVAAKAERLLNALTSLKPLSMQTSNISVTPVWSYAKTPAKLSGYSATYSIIVKCLIQNTGKLVDVAMDAGAGSIVGPQLSASTEARNQAQLQAIELATKNAKKQVEASLSALGLRAISINQINVQNANIHPTPLTPRVALMADMGNAANNATPIEAGQEQLQAQVTIVASY